jgi:predicted HicB family RNase H-like nuclease
VPNKPATPKHGVRVPDDLWQAVKRAAADQGETVTDVIVRALKRYVRDHPAGD